jgi:peptidyl-prolyl cis-trans isomerase A (cyclophilin A)
MNTHRQVPRAPRTRLETPALSRWALGPWRFRARLVLALSLLGLACRPSPPPGPDPRAEELEAQEREIAAERTAEPSVEPEPGRQSDAPAERVGPLVQREEQAVAPAERHPALLDPSRARETAPERYTVSLDTTKGEILVDVRRSWAPLGADRFYNLVKIGYFDDTAFFRVVAGFMAQIGIHGDPEINRVWRTQRIEDDPVAHQNAAGTVSFATSGKNSRVNQIFINLVDNSRLDAMGFAPIGRVRGLDVVEQLHSGYGEGAPAGRGPLQARVQNEGNAYLRAEFPQLDYIRSAKVVDEKTGR